MPLLLSSLLLGLMAAAEPRSAKEWASRTVYQLLTDRFASDGADRCGDNLSVYCGGTFKGIKDRLDYIQGMGFDAIWISPVVANYGDGYHGYWATDLTSVNPNFGTVDDLRSMVDAAHSKGIWVMLDMVVNHMGGTIGDIGGFKPFNDNSHYHGCDSCPSDCNIHDFTSDNEVEQCRLAGLPDLNQENEFVANELIEVYTKWINNSNIDGIRMDTVPEVSPSYWKKFKEGLGDIFIIGEVFNGDSNYCNSHGSNLDSVLSYPMFYTIRDVFQSQQDMTKIWQRLSEYENVFGSKTSVLGTFVDNHDNPRFMSQQGDSKLFLGAILLSLTLDGLPIMYYGSEQYFKGGGDPQCREKLWTSNYNTQSEGYLYVQTVNTARKHLSIWESPVENQYADSNFASFNRGKMLVGLTNVGSNGGNVKRTVTSHPFNVGDTVCNIFYPEKDCVTVSDQGFMFDMNGGESKVFVPQSVAKKLSHQLLHKKLFQQ